MSVHSKVYYSAVKKDKKKTKHPSASTLKISSGYQKADVLTILFVQDKCPQRTGMLKTNSEEPIGKAIHSYRQASKYVFLNIETVPLSLTFPAQNIAILWV